MAAVHPPLSSTVTQTVDRTLYSYLQPAPPTKDTGSLPSGYSLPGGGAAVTKPSPVDDSFLIDLPPMSQLDCSVLDALPSAMRNQILRSYEKSLNSEDAQLSKLVEREREELLSLLTSTADASTTSVQQPEDVLTSISEQDNIISDHSTVYKREAEATCGAERASVQAEEVATSATEDDAVILIGNQDNFLKEFRQYLKEWLAASTDGPTESDALKFTDFLTTFAQSNLEVTQIMLRFFRRHILQLERRKWSLYFNALLAEVQDIVKKCSGGTLKISELNV